LVNDPTPAGKILNVVLGWMALAHWHGLDIGPHIMDWMKHLGMDTFMMRWWHNIYYGIFSFFGLVWVRILWCIKNCWFVRFLNTWNFII
jgi:hypothetical protein